MLRFVIPAHILNEICVPKFLSFFVCGFQLIFLSMDSNGLICGGSKFCEGVFCKGFFARSKELVFHGETSEDCPPQKSPRHVRTVGDYARDSSNNLHNENYSKCIQVALH
ncbi:hypothetical protein KFK09_004560 [Dendrobium nobile]|uniref:Uncharacterized protein n=1 Tax=Dendrobium nobile TaxID=94219 RepID=A0A8T3C6K5_DENNO|nr:hypothetical protein KFK09_004560 [Dendrobium nobile]